MAHYVESVHPLPDHPCKVSTERLCDLEKDGYIQDAYLEKRLNARRVYLTQATASFSAVELNDFTKKFFDPKPGPDQPTKQRLREEIQIKLEGRYGRGPYVINGVPIAPTIEGCCNKDPCFCRSDLIFCDGIAYDQKPFIQGHLRTRPNNVMFFEGKMAGPFNPGKSPLKYGSQSARDKHPRENSFNYTVNNFSGHPCCTTSIYGDRFPPYNDNHKLGYTRMGLPHGKTVGYFRFRPEHHCYDNGPTVARLEDCCDCQPLEYDASQYIQNQCPAKSLCC